MVTLFRAVCLRESDKAEEAVPYFRNALLSNWVDRSKPIKAQLKSGPFAHALLRDYLISDVLIVNGIAMSMSDVVDDRIVDPVIRLVVSEGGVISERYSRPLVFFVKSLGLKELMRELYSAKHNSEFALKILARKVTFEEMYAGPLYRAAANFILSFLDLENESELLYEEVLDVVSQTHLDYRQNRLSSVDALSLMMHFGNGEFSRSDADSLQSLLDISTTPRMHTVGMLYFVAKRHLLRRPKDEFGIELLKTIKKNKELLPPNLRTLLDQDLQLVEMLN